MEDYYELLGVGPGASPEEIARAYRKRAVIRHRTRVVALKGQLEDMERAFETLSDPGKRAEYDARLRAAQSREASRSNERVRSEGRRRAALSKEMGLASLRIGQEALAANSETVQRLAEEHDLLEERRLRLQRFHRTVQRGVGVVLLISLVVVLVLLLVRR